MKKIGQGAFTTAYLKNSKTVTLHSIDNIKECMSMGWFPNSRLFPRVKYIETKDDKEVYEMKYYPKVKSLKNNLKPKQYNLYKELREFNGSFNMENIRRKFKKIKNRNTRRVLIEAVEACANYGEDVCFEISPRNVAVNNGNLILLDCFFIHVVFSCVLSYV